MEMSELKKIEKKYVWTCPNCGTEVIHKKTIIQELQIVYIAICKKCKRKVYVVD